jgi:hypothetical protein
MTAIVTSIFVWSSLGASAFVSVMFLVNLLFFRKATVPISRNALASGSTSQPDANALRLSDSVDQVDIGVSVLIPARNEALRIGPLLDSVLASEGVSCDLCVLDDESQDGTDAIVEAYSKKHPNVRLLKGTRVPAGWSGKQYACYQLAQQAKHEELVFLDADVALTKDALRRAIMQRRRNRADLLSGFPRQQVITIGEQLLIPLIHVILLCFLPFALMRWTRMTGAAAGCGQFFLTTKRAYEQTGGHGAIRQSLHDGIMLPRAYRMSGLKTDLFDASDLARCRMYTSFSETWSGLMKNANEGFAKMPLLPIMTVLMLLAFVGPVLSAVALWLNLISEDFQIPITVACVLSYLPRVLCCLKFDRAWLACALNPTSIILFLVIQWIALIRKSQGKGVKWRQRSYEMATS